MWTICILVMYYNTHCACSGSAAGLPVYLVWCGIVFCMPCFACCAYSCHHVGRRKDVLIMDLLIMIFSILMLVLFCTLFKHCFEFIKWL